ncbi:MAG: metallophosphoesterase [Eubacterium sp.]|nr:metallophosphoesterase [Eubacterium sp.]
MSIGLIAVFFLTFTLTLRLVNAVIIYLHVIAFFLLSGLVLRLIRFLRNSKPEDPKEKENEGKSAKKTKAGSAGKGNSGIKVSASGKVTKVKTERTGHLYWQGWLALIYSVLYLGVAYYLCVNVWQTDYSLQTDKSIGTLKVAMLADSHIGATFDGNGFGEHMQNIMKQNPDIILIPGDFVDEGTSREDMVTACAALGKIHPKYGVYFSYGNHDKGQYGYNNREYTAEELDAELRKNGVHVLEDELEYPDDNLCIVGRKDASRDSDRKPLEEILKDVDESKYIIVMDHEPRDYELESQTAADLVVSGHTHGGQFFPVTYLGEWFGINDRVYGYEKRNNTEFIVTSGIADWQLVFKTGTKSEYDIIEIKGK